MLVWHKEIQGCHHYRKCKNEELKDRKYFLNFLKSSKQRDYADLKLYFKYKI